MPGVFEKALEWRPENGSRVTDCRSTSLKPGTFIVVDDHFRAAHYSTQSGFPPTSMAFFYTTDNKDAIKWLLVSLSDRWCAIIVQ